MPTRGSPTIGGAAAAADVSVPGTSNMTFTLRSGGHLPHPTSTSVLPRWVLTTAWREPGWKEDQNRLQRQRAEGQADAGSPGVSVSGGKVGCGSRPTPFLPLPSLLTHSRAMN